MAESEIRIRQSDDGQTEVQVKFDQDTVWLSQKQMAQLFDKDPDTISLRLKNIYNSGELDESSTMQCNPYASYCQTLSKKRPLIIIHG